MKKWQSNLLYNILVNIPVCFSLCLAAALLAGSEIDWANFTLNFIVSFLLAMTIGFFVPLVAIGKWFTALFHLDNSTYRGNLPYRLLATFISSCIFFFVISPSLTLMNFFLSGSISAKDTFLHWLLNAPLLFLVSYFSTLLSDIPAYKNVHRMDPNF